MLGLFSLLSNVVYCPQNGTFSNQLWELGSDFHGNSDPLFLEGTCYEFKFLGPTSQRLGNLPVDLENLYPSSAPSWVCMCLICAPMDQMSIQ